MVPLFSIPGDFSPLFADRTPIISQTNTKQHPSKPQNKGLETWYNNWSWVSIVGLSLGVNHGLRRQLDRRGFLEGAFGQVYQLMVNGVVTWKRNSQNLGVPYNNCHHLALPCFTWGLSRWWDFHWLVVESLFESPSGSALKHFTSVLCFFFFEPTAKWLIHPRISYCVSVLLNMTQAGSKNGNDCAPSYKLIWLEMHRENKVKFPRWITQRLTSHSEPPN